jgi:uncharacterized protein DUF3108
MNVRFAAAIIALSTAASAAAPNWQASLTKSPPGNFAEPRSLRALYHFGWSGLTAATAEANFNRASPDRFQIDGTARTIGLARALWRYDVNYKTADNAHSLAPIETTQDETFRTKKVRTHLAFGSSGVTRTRTDGSGAATTKEFPFPKVLSLSAAMLYLRSQPLQQNDVYRVVVYPTTSPYLATLTVTGRERISIRPGSYPAIKMDLQLSKIGKQLELEPHKKFRKATVWLSDDADRLPLRIEAQIFVGTIFAELQSVKFEQERP